MTGKNATQSKAEQILDNDVALVIPSTCDAIKLNQFLQKATQMFGARVSKTIGSKKKTLVMLKLQEPIPPAIIMEELANIPEVKEVEEKTRSAPGELVSLVLALE